MKRTFDLLVSLTVLICLFPIILFVSILIRISLGSPIIFRQQRPGLNGKPFYVFKLRTMTDEKDSTGNLLPDSIRLTKLGSFLRKFSLDELIQLINVVKGEMSLVGPRPLLMEYLPLYSKKQAKRHLVKPGITGWAQVNGRNNLSWEERFELDVWYVNNQSFFLDMKILFMTVWKVFKTEGVNQKGHVTMEIFKGSNSNVKEGHG